MSIPTVVQRAPVSLGTWWKLNFLQEQKLFLWTMYLWKLKAVKSGLLEPDVPSVHCLMHCSPLGNNCDNTSAYTLQT